MHGLAVAEVLREPPLAIDEREGEHGDDAGDRSERARAPEPRREDARDDRIDGRDEHARAVRARRIGDLNQRREMDL